MIHHEDARLDHEVIAPWLASFSDLVGIVRLPASVPARRRIRRELQRVGLTRFADVLAFRLYYKLLLARRDRRWEDEVIRALGERFGPPLEVPVHATASPNTAETERFLIRMVPDLVIVRCRMLLAESVFSIPRHGTFVLHPGMTPEYRNSHGGFWALARRDVDKVATTLLRIDAGVDTGPVFGYYTYPFDERRESHVVIQKRTLLENLDAIRDKLLEIHAGTATTIDTSGRESRAWGQPWLTQYLAWKRRARASVP